MVNSPRKNSTPKMASENLKKLKRMGLSVVDSFHTVDLISTLKVLPPWTFAKHVSLKA